MAQDTPHPKYKVIHTDSGKWLVADGADFVFAFVAKDFDEKVEESVTKAFENALLLSSTIKKAVKDTTGKDVVNGLCVADHSSMIKAMNSIDGMAEQSAVDKKQHGDTTAVRMNQEFFGSVLAGLGGDIVPLQGFLKEKMSALQGQAKKSKDDHVFGTVIGTVSLMPVLNVPVTTFKYAYLSGKSSKWFLSVKCGSVSHQSYDYKYTAVDFSYVNPTALED